MRVLVTGGSGFIAAWVIRRVLARGWEPRIFDVQADRRVVREIAGPVVDELDWVVGDVRDADQVIAAARGCDAAVHLAGLLTPACRADPVRGAQVNLIGSLNVFEAAKRHGLSIVAYTSSAGVYGPDQGVTPRPTTHYGAFKLAVEGSARAYWADDGVRSVGFRPFVVYGPGRESGLSAGPTLACRAAARREPYVIPFTGSSDLLYVDDVACAFEVALQARPAGAHVFNLLGQVATVDEVIREIRRCVPEAALTSEGPTLPINAHLAVDTLADILPGLQHTGLSEGVAATVAYYRGESGLKR
ncbi:UDP-N-acetylglucosamine 4-epimerase OS=Castellaniella defragrans OX=75697 GN=HNR28_001802 PE=4 SV=1 [Castellaniella defragrans]